MMNYVNWRKIQQVVDEIASNQKKIILLCHGPTGCGKYTTVIAVLHSLRSPYRIIDVGSIIWDDEKDQNDEPWQYLSENIASSISKTRYEVSNNFYQEPEKEIFALPKNIKLPHITEPIYHVILKNIPDYLSGTEFVRSIKNANLCRDTRVICILTEKNKSDSFRFRSSLKDDVVCIVFNPVADTFMKPFLKAKSVPQSKMKNILKWGQNDFRRVVQLVQNKELDLKDELSNPFSLKQKYISAKRIPWTKLFDENIIDQDLLDKIDENKNIAPLEFDVLYKWIVLGIESFDMMGTVRRYEETVASTQNLLNRTKKRIRTTKYDLFPLWAPKDYSKSVGKLDNIKKMLTRDKKSLPESGLYMYPGYTDIWNEIRSQTPEVHKLVLKSIHENIPKSWTSIEDIAYATGYVS